MPSNPHSKLSPEERMVLAIKDVQSGKYSGRGVAKVYSDHTSPGSSLWDLLQQEEFKDESVTSVGNWNHIGA
jgi:hypothetical protein